MKNKKHTNKKTRLKQMLGILLLIAALSMYLSSIFFFV